MKMTGHEFYMLTDGKQFDMDGAYGYQCWDLFAYFCDVMGYPRINCTSTGYVIDIWRQRMTNGLYDHFIEVGLGDLKDGDWCVFDFGNTSHIAMFRVENGDGTATFLGQNQGSPYVNQKYYTVDNIVGAFRSKDMIVADEPKNYHATVITDVLNIRSAPSLSAEIVDTYTSGEGFYFQKRHVAEGYTWAEYTSYNGNQRFVALGENYGEQYCVID